MGYRFRDEPETEPRPQPNGHAADGGYPGVPAWALLTYGDAIEAKAASYLVKNLVNHGEFSAWYGPPKSGKSFVVLDLMLHIAAGRSWRGRRVRQGRVLYLALEGGNGIGNRLVAAQGKFGTGHLPFHVLTVPLDLLNGDADPLLAFINAKIAELGGAFNVIVLDTLSRSMPGGNENSPETMTMLVGVLDRLRAATKAHVAVVHHTGKDADKGMRGHSALLGAVDLAVEIRDGNIRVADTRECPEGDTWGFDLQAVKVGTDEDDDPVFSCVVRELADGEEPTPRKGRPAERRTRPSAPSRGSSSTPSLPPSSTTASPPRTRGPSRATSSPARGSCDRSTSRRPRSATCPAKKATSGGKPSIGRWSASPRSASSGSPTSGIGFRPNRRTVSHDVARDITRHAATGVACRVSHAAL